MNDWQLSQLISHSLAAELSPQQQAELKIALARSPASTAFAEWSSRIQAAVAAQVGAEAFEQLDASPSESSEGLSDISKERLQRAIRAEQTRLQWDDSQKNHLLVAQTPLTYSHGSPVASPRDDTPPDLPLPQIPANEPAGQELQAQGRRLCDRLSLQISGVVQTVQLVTELVSLSSLGGRPIPPADLTPAEALSTPLLSPEQLSQVLLALLKVRPDLATLSIASCRDLQFHELVRAQRSPRDALEIGVIPQHRLRRGAASSFHQTLLAAPAAVSAEVDSSISGWQRFVVGLALVENSASESAALATTASAAWGLATAEVAIDKLLREEMVAVGVTAEVLLIDHRDGTLFSSSSSLDDMRLANEQHADWRQVLGELPKSGEAWLSQPKIWIASIVCPPPLGRLRVVLRVSKEQ
jgi:hypothetical protein